jgi:hypothetical protein
MTTGRKPIRVFYSRLSGRFYATRAYRLLPDGLVECTGEKFDVTDDIAAFIKPAPDAPSERFGHDTLGATADGESE